MGFVSVEISSQFFIIFNFSSVGFYYFLCNGTLYNSLYKLLTMQGLLMSELRAETGYLQVMLFFNECSIIHLYLIFIGCSKILI